MLLQKILLLIGLVLISSSEGCVPVDDTTLICNGSNFQEALSDTTRNLVLRNVSKIVFSAHPHRKPFLQVEHLEVTQTLLFIKIGSLKVFPNLKTLNIFNVTYKEIKGGAFQGLHNLHTLNVMNAGVEMMYPNGLRHMHKLELLLLSRNNLKSLPEGVFDSLHKLITLRLDNNQICAIFPKSFLGLHKLTVLSLSNNTLTEVNATQFNMIHQLENLNLDFNRISALYGSFRLPKLGVIKLNDNKLTNLSDKLFATCPNLRKVDLSNNKLVSLRETPFLRLGNLTQLNLTGSGVDVQNFKQLSGRNALLLESPQS